MYSYDKPRIGTDQSAAIPLINRSGGGQADALIRSHAYFLDTSDEHVSSADMYTSRDIGVILYLATPCG